MTKIKKVPFSVTAEAGATETVLTLSGTIQKRYWSDDKFIDAKLVRDQLDSVKNDIVIRLNSTGGDVFQGVEIYNYLKSHPSKITVEVMGTAASAATFICAGADEVIMNTGTTFMIHRGATLAWGNKNDVEATLKMLETIDESIINIYTELTGQTAEQIESWMDEEKWFTASEAVQYGFASSTKTLDADKSISDKNQLDIAAMIQTAVISAMADFQQPLANQKKEPQKNKSLLGKLRKEV